jgi:hypothetical protein
MALLQLIGCRSGLYQRPLGFRLWRSRAGRAGPLGRPRISRRRAQRSRPTRKITADCPKAKGRWYYAAIVCRNRGVKPLLQVLQCRGAYLEILTGILAGETRLEALGQRGAIEILADEDEGVAAVLAVLPVAIKLRVEEHMHALENETFLRAFDD